MYDNSKSIENSIVSSGDTFIICPVCGLPLCVGYRKPTLVCGAKCVPQQQYTLNGKTFCHNSSTKDIPKIKPCSCNGDKTNGRFEYKLMLIIYQQQSQIEQLEYQIATIKRGFNHAKFR